jgi:integrase
MPLKLVPPRKGKSPNWTIRGTYLKVAVDRSSGTHRKAAAERVRRQLEEQIERGEYPPQEPKLGAPTFLSAAIAYMKAGRRRRYVARLIEHFGETPLADVNQAAIDAAAIELHPNVTPCTRNTCVYTPMSAILRHAGIDIKLRRPKGAKGRVITDYLTPDDAAAIIQAAETFDAELGLLLKFLLYTGVRLGEALALHWDSVALEERSARIRISKNTDPRELRLREDLCAGLVAHMPSEAHGRVFRFHQGGWLKSQLLRAKLAACGLSAPERPKKGVCRQVPPHRLSWVNFHTFRHTWASWMRRYSGTDSIGLVATGNWRDPRSAARYAHAVARDEWSRVDMLPAVDSGKSAEKGR